MSSNRYATVTATLALVVALGGTGYAAAQLTGKDIKNGSIAGKDIKKESLGSKQIKSVGVGEIAGPTVRAYARLNSDYTMDTARSSGITMKPGDSGGGFYCLNYVAGTPKSAMAVIDFTAGDTRVSQVATTVEPATIAATGCDPGTDLIATTGNTAVAGSVGYSFYVWVLA